jgi:hypothetical protein
MLYRVKVLKVYQYYYQQQEVVNLELISESEEALDQIISLHKRDFGKLFGGLVSFLQPLNYDHQKYESFNLEELKAELKQTLKRWDDWESVKSDLQKQIADLSEVKLRKEKDELNNQLRKAKEDVKSKDKLIKELQGKLDTQKLFQEETKKYQQKYEQLSNEWENLVPQYYDLRRQVNSYSSLRQENVRLCKEKSNLDQEIERLKISESSIKQEKHSINQELEETQKKLNMAMARLHGQTEKSGIAGGGSRSDKLKNDFSNLKMGLFREASNKVLECWKKQDSALNYRSEEFSEIRSVVSRCVFIDGMYIFAGDKSEVNESVKLIINELFSIEGLSPTQIQAVQHKVEAVLLKSKSVDGSNEALTSNIEATTNKIQEDLWNIRNVYLSQDVLQEIKKFVEAALKLVREIVNDTPPGEFYTPEVREKFDENSHDTRDEPEGQVKLTICAGYRIPGNILVKADVVTIPETPTPPEENSIANASDGESEIPTPHEENNTANAYDGEDGRSTPLKETDTGNAFDDKSEVQTPPEETNTGNASDDKSEIQTPPEETNTGNASGQPETQTTEKIYTASFKGTVWFTSGVKSYTEPKNNEEYFSDITLAWKSNPNFDAWTYGDEVKYYNKTDCRWYKTSSYQLWVPAAYIKGEPPNSSPFPPKEKGNSNE